MFWNSRGHERFPGHNLGQQILSSMKSPDVPDWKTIEKRIAVVQPTGLLPRTVQAMFLNATQILDVVKHDLEIWETWDQKVKLRSKMTPRLPPNFDGCMFSPALGRKQALALLVLAFMTNEEKLGFAWVERILQLYLLMPVSEVSSNPVESNTCYFKIYILTM